MPLKHEEALVQAAIEAHREMAGAALPILHAVQDSIGYIPDSALPTIAEALNVSRAEMHGIVTFYHDFRREPAGQHVVKVCRAEACQAAGGRDVAERLSRQLGLAFGETSPDGQVTLEAVYCLGLCACAPSAMVDGRVMGRLDTEAAERIAGEVQA